ncbi:MAG: lyase family protein, partial [Pseudomonadota bacterium]
AWIFLPRSPSRSVSEISMAEQLAAALAELGQQFADGDFVLDARFEDCHSAIEISLTERLGDLGKKIHAGRSRNDQVLVASRLYLRAQLERINSLCASIATASLDRAQADALTPMPGYTHLQRAVVSSVGLWFAGLAEAFIDNASLARDTAAWLNANPLGTAAGYGVNLPLERALTTEKLNFDRMQVNPMYAQNSRGKFELQALTAAAQALLDCRRFAWDLSLYTTAEFDFVSMPDEYTTGSSIMPNKRNPDVVELMRGAYGVVQGAMAELQAGLSLPSGYHRDLQRTKGPMIRGLVIAVDTLELTDALVRDLTLNTEAMAAAIEPAMYATDVALEKVADGIPFREAYRQAMDNPDALASRSPAESLEARVSPGAAGNLQLDQLRARLDQL